MSTDPGDTPSSPTWFVGASFDHTDDQSARFLKQGIWEINNPTEKEKVSVRAMRPGNRIAIKAAYVRKNNLPFNNRKQSVSVMRIKAVGVITENLEDGKRIKVRWQPVEGVREWYFYTYRPTIWRVAPGEWAADALIAFAFEDKPQDIERFRNAPYWKDRFGTQFQWADFYEAVAEKLLAYANDRASLIAGIYQIATQVEGLGYLQDKFPDGSSGPLQDICPFTVMGTFNRSMTVANRRLIARALADFLGVTVPVPSSFDGIPVLNNQNSWFFGYAKNRGKGDIDALWRVFSVTKKLIENESSAFDTRDAFIQAYDAATKVWGVKWNLSIGLYWVSPWEFPTLDGQSRRYIKEHLGLTIGNPDLLLTPFDATAYLQLADDLRIRFAEDDYPVHSFPELSLAAWQYKGATGSGDSNSMQPADVDNKSPADSGQSPAPTWTGPWNMTHWCVRSIMVPYSVDDILKDGCFLERTEIDLLLDRLRAKKNLILQGPPGTGKTWLAKRLAFALMGQKDDSKIRAVQFHPNLSYEDFVRGWRPTGEGKLSLVDGVFMEAIKAAHKEPSSKFVVVIEEINRGNPAQIFGELLTLLEAGKRTPSEALELCYPDADGVRSVHIPENLYVIGTMNIADRSLALVDLALRRRFAFVGLEPRLGPVWKEWIVKSCGVDDALASSVEQRITKLNEQIAGDPRLGKQFLIGHSYVTPVHRLEAGDTRKWFRQIVETEIGPLLEEYWFDAPDEAHKAMASLLKDW